MVQQSLCPDTVTIESGNMSNEAISLIPGGEKEEQETSIAIER